MKRNIIAGIPIVLVAIMAALAGVAAVSAGALPGGISAAVPGAPGKVTGDAPALAAGSGFTYQGRLSNGSGPASGQFDLVFTLFDAASGANQIGSPITMTNQTVSSGLFNVTLDFGVGAFNGDARWLEVAVRPSGTGSFATLTPRQQLTAAPYALGLAPGAGVTGTLAGPMLTLSNTMGAGLYSQSTSNNGVTGVAASSGTSGVYGENFSQGYGVAARNNATAPLVAAIYGQNVVTGTGVYGTGGAYGVIGYASLSNGTGVYASAYGTSSYGLFATSSSGVAAYGTSTSGTGVEGISTNGPGVKGSSTTNYGVWGISTSNYGVYASSASNVGVYGVTSTTFASGVAAVYGNNTGGGNNTSGGPGVKGNSANGYGVYGTTNNILYAGVYGNNTSGRGYGLYGSGGTTDGIGVYGTAGGGGVHGYSPTGNGVFGQTAGNSGKAAVYGMSTTDAVGVRGQSATGNGVYATGGVDAVYGSTCNIFYAGVYGTNTSGHGYGLYGRGGTTDGVGVYGTAGSLGGQFVSTNGTGVYASGTANGIEGHSNNGIASGVYGDNFGGGYGIAARSGVTGTAFFADNWGGTAGNFRGNVTVQGSLSKGGGSFKIDHPLDPANKYLYHSFVESPDMMNLYNGNVTLDANGEATVKMPDWFDALNKEFRYQLTTIGGFAPVYIAQEMQGDTFRIAGGKPGMKVSWMVTGIRHDPWAEEHRIPVEEDKAPKDRGKYLYPDAYGKPETMGIGYEQTQQLAQSQARPTLEHGR